MFTQPKEDVVVTSARKGTCATCGAKDVLVTHPPMSRHVDMFECDVQRGLNVIAQRAQKVNR